MKKIYFQQAKLYRKSIGTELLQKMYSSKLTFKSLLEIGPGKGEIISEFISNSKLKELNLSFIEPDSTAIFNLQNRFPKSEIYNENLEQFLNKQFMFNQFDIIFANFSLHWVENIEARLVLLRELLTNEGLIGFSNTDSKRSFWADINKQVQLQFPGSSLFNIENTHSLNAKQWLEMFNEKGFTLVSETHYEGVAAVFDSPNSALSDFKMMVGKNYLKLSTGVTSQDIETFVLKILNEKKNENGQVEVNASGYSMVFKR